MILHADERLIVIDKPAGLLAVPGRGADKADCAAARVMALYPDARIVHRLDMATSGLMLMARGAVVQRMLSRAFEDRRVDKRYLAIVHGLLHDDTGEITLPVGADWPNRPRQRVSAEHGKPATTRWRVLQRDATTTRVALEAITGRTHQLRVHLAAIGHAIVGDALYAAPASADTTRLMLHAWTLALSIEDEALRFEAPPPF